MAGKNFTVTAAGALQPDALRAGPSYQTKTLSSGAFTLDYGLVTVAAESGTTDDLTTINGAEAGVVAFLRADTGDTITVKHNTGNIYLSGTADVTLSGSTVLGLIYNDGASRWVDISNGAASGGGGGGTFSGCSLNLPSAQTITSGSTGAAIAFGSGSETFDTDSYHSTVTNNTRITIPSTAYYLVVGVVQWAHSSNDTDRRARIPLNGSSPIASIMVRPITSGSIETFITMTAIVSLTASDYIELYAAQVTGSNLDVNAAYFQITKLGT